MNAFAISIHPGTNATTNYTLSRTEMVVCPLNFCIHTSNNGPVFASKYVGCFPFY